MTMRWSQTLPLLLSLVAVGCTSGSSGDETPDDTGRPSCEDAPIIGCAFAGSVERNLSPQVPAADADVLARDNARFALALYEHLRETPGNLFYSPHSISTALAMTWAGAREQTERDIATALQFTLPQDRLHPAFNALDLALASRGKRASHDGASSFRLVVANSLWGQLGYTFENPFLNVLSESYGSPLYVADFKERTQDSIEAINGWVSEKTENKVNDLLSSPPVTADTRFVLTNAIYFSASWAERFEVGDTQYSDFATQAGARVNVPMMRALRNGRYGAGAGYQAIALPYHGDEVEMVLVVPDDLDAFEQGLDFERFDEVVAGLTPRAVKLEMPRFSIDAKFKLKELLSKLGMASAFTSEANLSGISTSGSLALAEVVHQSFVSVDESGTEAAASTAVIGFDVSSNEPPSVKADRPFLFFIRDRATQAVIFVGRVSNPLDS
ncbi:serpin family protein [Chondromyces crocatus]|uniref:Serpin domain-containing protein n=1 Tax=Chondromyces crocatus TaxID=52 RepID=A0A0K1EMW8_CHOCO|nr:serpin family protein [Chondromyces crocatus]AKT42189.1 uncharacterized protein CMC5_064120 [Chondromyces crocatus]